MINGKREKIEFSCTNCFRSVVLLVFVLSTALSMSYFSSLTKKKIINLVLVIKYYFDVRFQFDMVFKNAFFKVFTEVFLNNGSCNNMI